MNRKSKLVEKRKLLKLYNETKHAYGSGAYFNKEKNRIIRYNINSPAICKYAKRKFNKQARRFKGDISNGNYYRKISERWSFLE